MAYRSARQQAAGAFADLRLIISGAQTGLLFRLMFKRLAQTYAQLAEFD